MKNFWRHLFIRQIMFKAPFTRCRYDLKTEQNHYGWTSVHTMSAWKLLENGIEWKRNACRYQTKTEPLLLLCKYPKPVGFHSGTRLGDYGLIICQYRKVRSTEFVSYRLSCERLSIRNRIMPLPGQWCRFQTIPASCEQSLKVNSIQAREGL